MVKLLAEVRVYFCVMSWRAIEVCGLLCGRVERVGVVVAVYVLASYIVCFVYGDVCVGKVCRQMGRWNAW